MKGTILSFRRGRHTYTPRQFIIKVDKVNDKKSAEKLINKKVVWKSPQGKIINGKISNAHGNSGALRVLFEKGLPGQAVLSEVEII